MHSAKHFDPELGIDIHVYVFPPLPAPVPLPTPHIGIVLDPFDYIPIIGGTVHVNGVKRATAGTGGLDVHIPLGLYHPMGVPEGPLGPQCMGEEIFMGSMTVVADGDPLSRIGMPVLDCNFIGMINPFRLKKPKKPQRAMSLPTALNLAIPNTVNVGGPPMISIMGMAFKGLFAGLGRLRRSARFQGAMERFRNVRRARFADMPSSFLKCKVLRAEPVDIRSGSVVVEHADFDIPGRLPLAWTRRYTSGNDRAGACGHGWETPADTRLEIEPDGAAVFRPADGALAVFPRLPDPQLDNDAVFELIDGAVLTRVTTAQGIELSVRTKDDRVFVFAAPAANVAPLHAPLAIAIERFEDRSGNHWRFERAGGRLVRIAESGIHGLQGRFLEIDEHGGRIQRIALHDPASGTSHALVRYRYDDAGDLAAAHDALDAPRTFEYRAHRMVRHTDRTGLSFSYAYDAQWRVLHAWGDRGLYDYRFAYDELLRETEVTDSLGHVSTIKFDADDLPLCEIDPLGGVTVFEYDDWGRTTAIIDPAGLRTEFGHDERGNLVELVRPDGSRIATAYDDDAKPVAITDPVGGRWMQVWDTRGLLVAQTTPLGARSGYEYDAHGQLRRHTNARGAVTQLAFDRHGQLQSLTNALGHATRFEHDALGRLLRRTDPAGRSTAYTYDAKGRLLQAVLPGGASVHCEYDTEDQLLRYRDERGGVTKLEYFGIGQIARRVQPDGHSVRYLYDTEEQLTGVVNQRGETYRLQRDALGRIVEEIDYWGQARRYAYDAAGRITVGIDPLGRAIAFATDALGRIVRKTLPDVDDPGKQVSETFRYDPAGQLIELRNAASHVLRKFDADGRLVEEQQNGFKVENAYDELGNRTLRKTSAGNTVAIDFDLLDQPTRIAINDEAPITIERNAVGQATLERLSPHVTRTFAYNDQGLLTAQAVMKDGAPLFDTRFDYDAGGNLTQRSDSEHGADRYTYDPMGRILAHTDPTGQIKSYLNDPAGDRLKTRINEVQMKQAVGGAPEPALWAREGAYEGLHYSFDRAGNLTSRRHMNEPDQPELHLQWDANQRLAKSWWERGERHGQVTTYGYDPLGRRVIKRNPTQTTHFFWDGDALLGEVAADNEVELNASDAKVVVDFIAARKRVEALKALMPKVREYVYRPGTFEPLALIDRSAALASGRTTTRAGATVPAAAQGDASSPVRTQVSNDKREPSRSEAGGAARSGMLDGSMGLGMHGATPMASAGSPDARGVVGLGQGGSGLGSGMSLGAPPAHSDPKAAALPRQPLSPPMETAPRALSSASLARAEPAHVPQVFYYLNDPNGCPTRVASAIGQVVWAASYTAWGQVAKLRINLIAQSIRLQGQHEDTETGLYYNRHRYYDSGAGLFLSQDPIGLDSGIENIYEYGENTYSLSDPLGLWNKRRKNGQFSAKPGPKPKPSVHGNSKASTKPAVLYAQYDENGAFQKWGITQQTGNPSSRYGNKIPKDWDVIEITRGRRADMLRLERELASKLPGPKNFERWAGSAVGEELSDAAEKIAKKAGCLS